MCLPRPTLNIPDMTGAAPLTAVYVDIQVKGFNSASYDRIYASDGSELTSLSSAYYV